MADVDVRVRSLSLGTSFSGSSGENGTITFPDLFEDFYEIRAQKIGHSSFIREVFVEAPGISVEAFLQVNPVSYTFSVVEVPVLDTYVVTVKSTFETQVPRPVSSIPSA